MNGTAGKEGGGTGSTSSMQFLFTHSGRTLEADQTPEDSGMEDGDEILAVELMDLTDGPGLEDIVSTPRLAKSRLCTSTLRIVSSGRRILSSEAEEGLDR